MDFELRKYYVDLLSKVEKNDEVSIYNLVIGNKSADLVG